MAIIGPWSKENFLKLSQDSTIFIYTYLDSWPRDKIVFNKAYLPPLDLLLISSSYSFLSNLKSNQGTQSISLP